jgi:hypothetical protein
MLNLHKAVNRNRAQSGSEAGAFLCTERTHAFLMLYGLHNHCQTVVTPCVNSVTTGGARN